MKDLLDDLIHFFKARNTGNATNDLLNRCKKAQARNYFLTDGVPSYSDDEIKQQTRSFGEAENLKSRQKIKYKVK